MSEFFLSARVTSEETEIVPFIATFKLFYLSGTCLVFLPVPLQTPGKVRQEGGRSSSRNFLPYTKCSYRVLTGFSPLPSGTLWANVYIFIVSFVFIRKVFNLGKPLFMCEMLLQSRC